MCGKALSLTREGGGWPKGWGPPFPAEGNGRRAGQPLAYNLEDLHLRGRT